MRKSISTASMITLGVYPSFLVLMFILNLFSNRSFSFFGFGLDLEILESSAQIGLFIKPYFFLTFILVFAISLGIIILIDLFRSKERVVK